ncbi:sulfurtransferase [Thalassobacillus pellis]|uniref:sulfurtransferase n=1 Tax=Thalassobacillus pellis TaxID=748008 RepID=UPI001961061D|nr:sulfurtransferase [Thalassobacillus pellis]MBM7552518.1 thiosulfate/3-mercaptopyruvate sulfurtransferase [Thalassobacillus pellis]
MSNIISVTKAKELSDQKDVVFVDCRFDLADKEAGRESYLKEHLPEAVYFDLEKHLSGPVITHGGRHPLPELGYFQNVLAEAGISQHKIVIAYDQNKSAMSARLLWMLKFCGLDMAYILDGGLDAWKEAGYPTQPGETTPKKEVLPEFNIHHEMACGAAYVKRKSGEGKAVLVDSRNYKRFSGQEEPIDVKSGHIPGAIQFEWMNVYRENGTWKSKAELTALYADISSSNEVIVYCGSGVTAASNVIGLWEAGFLNVKLYVGSFSDWISYPDNEVAVSD